MASDSHQEGGISACLSSSVLHWYLPWQHMFILARLWRQCDSDAFCLSIANGAAIDALLTLMAVVDYYHGFILPAAFSRMKELDVVHIYMCVSLCTLLSCWHTIVFEAHRWAAQFHLPLVCILSLAADMRKPQGHIFIQMWFWKGNFLFLWWLFRVFTKFNVQMTCYSILKVKRPHSTFVFNRLHDVSKLK